MAQKIRLWEVTAEKSVSEIPGESIGLEEQLEDWLESDIALLDPDLLVIGRQVESALPETAQESQSVRSWVGATAEQKETALGIEGVFRTLDEVDAFVCALRQQADSAPP